MKFPILRTVTAVAVILAVVIGYFCKTGFGSLSSFGIDQIAAICPLGALESIIASHTLVPRVLIALLAVFIITIIFGRIFCGWVCPVPLIRRTFGVKDTDDEKPIPTLKEQLNSYSEPAVGSQPANNAEQQPVAQKEDQSKQDCTHCASDKKEDKFGRWLPYVILGGTLGSTAIFSFPVFCLICPVGITFALIIALCNLFAFNEPSWSILIFVAFLAFEILFFRHWCHKFCPLGAFISLMATLNRTFRPSLNKDLCLRTKDGIACNKCHSVCSEKINLHEKPSAMILSRCMKCHHCADICPTKAISFPFLDKHLSKKKEQQFPERKEPGKISDEERLHSFAEVNKDFDRNTAIEQASRCVDCGDCVAACPLHNPIPQWLGAVSEGNIRQAGQILFRPGYMPEICSRICPQIKLCEHACSLNKKGGAVPIGALSRFVSNQYLHKELTSRGRKRKNGMKVAVIGSGPSGLSCADVLSYNGFDVTVFEKNSLAGGLLSFGIPTFKLNKEAVIKRQKHLEKSGVVFKFNTQVGKDVDFNSILKDFEAVYIAIGASKANTLPLNGAEHPQIIQSSVYLDSLARQQLGLESCGIDLKDKKVVVLGGGDSAMDCLRSAIRQQASSVLGVVRSSEAKLRANRAEYEAAKHEGAKFLFETRITEIEFDDQGNLNGLQLVYNDGSTEIIPVDTVIVSFGSHPTRETWLEANGVRFDEHDRICKAADGLPSQTDNPQIFCGGDYTRGSNLAVNAIRDGQQAALSIIEFLKPKK